MYVYFSNYKVGVRGDVNYANQSIREIMTKLIETEEAVDTHERVLGYYLIAEIIFRRGPRGYTMQEMFDIISEQVALADKLMGQSGVGEHRHDALISDTKERAASMLAMIEEQMKK
jgi:hypothetical protein